MLDLKQAFRLSQFWSCVISLLFVLCCICYVESACPFRDVNLLEDIQKVLNAAGEPQPKFGIKNQGAPLQRAQNQNRQNQNLRPRKRKKNNYQMPCVGPDCNNRRPKQDNVDPATLCLELFDFHNLKDALNDSLTSRKPIMVVICQTWCGACTRLKQKMEKDKYVNEMAAVFNMVSLMGDDIPPDEELRPDGSYYPRILFLSPDGEVQRDIVNEEAVKQKRDKVFFYWDCISLAKSMLTATKRFLDISEEDFDRNGL